MANRTRDPVCKKDITGKTAACSMYRDRQYCFCSKECKAEFDRDPSAYT